MFYWSHLKRWLLLCVVSSILGCSASPPEPPIRIGYNNWPGYELIWLAEALGYFKAAGLRVEHVQFLSLSDASRAYARGQLDAFSGTAIELLEAPSPPEQSAVAIMVLDISNGADQIVASRSIHHVEDLVGTSVGIEAQSVNLQLAGLAVQRHRLEWQQMDWLPMSQAEMVEAMQQGRIQAAVTYAPFSEQMLADGNHHVVWSSADVPNHIVDMLLVNARHLRQHHPQWHQFVLAVDQAIGYFNAHEQEATEIMAQHAGLTVAQMRASIQGLVFPTLLEQPKLLGDNGSVVRSMTQVQQLLPTFGIAVNQADPLSLIDIKGLYP